MWTDDNDPDTVLFPKAEFGGVIFGLIFAALGAILIAGSFVSDERFVWKGTQTETSFPHVYRFVFGCVALAMGSAIAFFAGRIAIDYLFPRLPDEADFVVGAQQVSNARILWRDLDAAARRGLGNRLSHVTSAQRLRFFIFLAVLQPHELEKLAAAMNLRGGRIKRLVDRVVETQTGDFPTGCACGRMFAATVAKIGEEWSCPQCRRGNVVVPPWWTEIRAGLSTS